MKIKSISHVIVGDGAAGIAAASAIRASNSADRIVLISDDRQPSYYRAALTNYLSGDLSDDELWALPPDAWDKLEIERLLSRVERLDHQARELTLAGGRILTWDRLLITSGARSALPSIENLIAPAQAVQTPSRHVYTLRTMKDARDIIEQASRSRRAVIIGGGILGIEVAHGLHARNLEVTIVHRGASLLERVVDERASALIQVCLQRDGIKLATGVTTKAIERGSTYERVVLSDGRVLECDLVIICIGVTPNTEWLTGSGVALDRGYVVVDGQMSVPGCPGVWAAGDVAKVRDPAVPDTNPPGLWQPAQRQGQVAGLNMASETGRPPHYYRPGFIQNATKAWSLDLVTAGAHVEGEGERVAPFEGYRGNTVVYKRALLRAGRLVGFLLLGDRREAAALCQLMNLKGQAGNVESIKARLFDPGFDIFGWVAAQERQPGVARWKETLYLPRGFVPPSLAAKTPLRTQRSMVFREAPDEVAVATLPATELRLSFEGGTRQLANGAISIGGGVDPKQGVLVASVPASAGYLDIAAAGAAWLATPVGDRLPVFCNGVLLRRATFLSDSDVLQLGDWKAIVRLNSRQATGEPSARLVAGAPVRQEYVLLGQSRYALRSPVTSIGRASDNHIVIGADPEDPRIGFFHAQISEAAGGWYIVDAGSATGTTVNSEAVVSPRRLREGDAIGLGGITLVVRPAPSAQAITPEVRPAAESDAHCYLVCVEGSMAPRALRVRVPGTLGRDESASTVVDDPLLSRMHARIEFDASRYFIVDLGSLNGTSVEGNTLRAGMRRALTPGTQIRMGAHLFRFEVDEPSTFVMQKWLPKQAIGRYSGGTQLFRTDSGLDAFPTACELLPIATALSDEVPPIILRGPGIHVLGRSSSPEVVTLPFATISERHAEINLVAGRFFLRDLGSSNGTFLNGQRVDTTERVLSDGDEIRLHFLSLRFKVVNAAAASSVSIEHTSTPARFDNWESQQNPLESDLRKVVFEELDACIGCHMCMRACPLPEARTVTIAALNGYASGVVTASDTVKQFVEDCTQCHACVPVCPVNIRRSRIVLWNKLKSTPDPAASIVAQVSDGHARLELTHAQLEAELRDHALFVDLPQSERLRCLSSARVRDLMPGERLLNEGEYVDSLWLLVRGRLDCGAAIADHNFQRMVSLTPGKTVGERAVLSDGVTDTTVIATERSLVVGLPKYVLRDLASRNRGYQATLDSLYLARTAEAVLRACDEFKGASDVIIRRLVNETRAERYKPGNVILRVADLGQFICIVVRGFVKQVHKREGSEVVLNYLKAGAAFGAVAVHSRDPLLRWEAATLTEILVVKVERLRTQIQAEATAEVPKAIKAAAANIQPRSDTMTDSIMQAHQLMVIDTKRCVDCDNCVDACARRHGHSRIDRGGSGKQKDHYQIPGSCYHCEDPVCLLCAVDGIVRDPTGEIRIVEDNCIGCGACAERCPYDNIQMVAKTARHPSVLVDYLPESWRQLLGMVKKDPALRDYEKIAVKCDLCAGHDDGPACVRSCPTGAAQRVKNPSEFFSERGGS